MKNIHKISFSFALILLSFGQIFAEDGNHTSIEKKKVVSKSFNVTSKDNLLIDNQFGSVKINLWNKNEMRVDITITSNASSQEKAQNRLDAVDIVEKKNGDQFVFKTVMSEERNSSKWNWAWNKNDDKNSIQIDYVVSMPSNNALIVKNSFGNTSIPTFKAPLVVVSKYGNFSANDLTGSKNDIDVAFGKADIQQVENGKLEIEYSSLVLEHASTLTLINKFGKFKIGDVDKIDGSVSYSGNSSIGSVKNACKLKLSFSSGFKILQVPSSVENIDISASYSSVSLPMENNDCDFDVKVSYGSFRYSSDRKATFTQNDDKRDDDDHGPRLTKQYIGKFGNGNGTKIKIVSSFGEVSFK